MSIHLWHPTSAESGNVQLDRYAKSSKDTCFLNNNAFYPEKNFSPCWHSQQELSTQRPYMMHRNRQMKPSQLHLINYLPNVMIPALRSTAARPIILRKTSLPMEQTGGSGLMLWPMSLPNTGSTISTKSAPTRKSGCSPKETPLLEISCYSRTNNCHV